MTPPPNPPPPTTATEPSLYWPAHYPAYWPAHYPAFDPLKGEKLSDSVKRWTENIVDGAMCDPDPELEFSRLVGDDVFRGILSEEDLKPFETLFSALSTKFVVGPGFRVANEVFEGHVKGCSSKPIYISNPTRKVPVGREYGGGPGSVSWLHPPGIKDGGGGGDGPGFLVGWGSCTTATPRWVVCGDPTNPAKPADILFLTVEVLRKFAPSLTPAAKQNAWARHLFPLLAPTLVEGKIDHASKAAVRLEALPRAEDAFSSWLLSLEPKVRRLVLLVLVGKAADAKEALRKEPIIRNGIGSVALGRWVGNFEVDQREDFPRLVRDSLVASYYNIRQTGDIDSEICSKLRQRLSVGQTSVGDPNVQDDRRADNLAKSPPSDDIAEQLLELLWGSPSPHAREFALEGLEKCAAANCQMDKCLDALAEMAKRQSAGALAAIARLLHCNHIADRCASVCLPKTSGDQRKQLAEALVGGRTSGSHPGNCFRVLMSMRTPESEEVIGAALDVMNKRSQVGKVLPIKDALRWFSICLELYNGEDEDIRRKATTILVWLRDDSPDQGGSPVQVQRYALGLLGPRQIVTQARDAVAEPPGEKVPPLVGSFNGRWFRVIAEVQGSVCRTCGKRHEVIDPARKTRRLSWVPDRFAGIEIEQLRYGCTSESCREGPVCVATEPFLLPAEKCDDRLLANVIVKSSAKLPSDLHVASLQLGFDECGGFEGFKIEREDLVRWVDGAWKELRDRTIGFENEFGNTGADEGWRKLIKRSGRLTGEGPWEYLTWMFDRVGTHASGSCLAAADLTPLAYRRDRVKLDEKHVARRVWDVVKRNLSVNGPLADDAEDRRLLLGLWTLATLDNVGSVYTLESHMQKKMAYEWMCGGLSVSRNALREFRVSKGSNQLIENCVNDLVRSNVASLDKGESAQSRLSTLRSLLDEAIYERPQV